MSGEGRASGLPRLTRAFALGVVVVAGGARIAAAHHSFAMFDPQKVVSVSGTVKEFQFTNPHCFIQLEAPGAAGAVQEWSIEMGPPAHLISQGWTRRTVKAGDRITVTMHPLRKGALGGSFVSATGADGKTL